MTYLQPIFVVTFYKLGHMRKMSNLTQTEIVKSALAQFCLN